MTYADRYDPDADFDRWYTDATAEALAPWVHAGDRVLELGCATGRMTAALVAAGATVVAVDHAPEYLDRGRARDLDGVEWVEADITTVAAGRGFDAAVLANVVHEVADPAALVVHAASHLRPGGLVHLTLQNPSSIHRLVGLEMGLVAALDDVSERGERFETVRILDADALEELGRAAGLEPVHRSGVMLKPLPNDLMAGLPDEVLWGFVRAARHLPEHAAMNHVVLRAPG